MSLEIDKYGDIDVRLLRVISEAAVLDFSSVSLVAKELRVGVESSPDDEYTITEAPLDRKSQTSTSVEDVSISAGAVQPNATETSELLSRSRGSRWVRVVVDAIVLSNIHVEVKLSSRRARFLCSGNSEFGIRLWPNYIGYSLSTTAIQVCSYHGTLEANVLDLRGTPPPVQRLFIMRIRTRNALHAQTNGDKGGAFKSRVH